jgi:topoisomerase-4 subunit A
LVVLNDGTYYTTDFELSNHYEDNVVVLEKFDSEKIWTAVLYDADQQNYPYLKRFHFEASSKKQNYLGENQKNLPVILSSQVYSRIKVTFGGADDFRAPLEIEAADFIGIKGIKAKGKRLTTFTIGEISELEPIRQPEIIEEENEEEEEELPDEEEDSDDDKNDNDIIDELTGQGKLF